MIAKNDECLTAASDAVFMMNSDALIRKRCLNREGYYRDIRNVKRQIAERCGSCRERCNFGREGSCPSRTYGSA